MKNSFLADWLLYAGFLAILLMSLGWHLWSHRQRDRAARRAPQDAGAADSGARGLHPHIATDWCIGCGACVTACPEGDVLAVIGGKAALVNGAHCIGHELCAEACPVGAIDIVTAPPSMTADLPALSSELETSIPNLFAVGELTGLALIKNAVTQGRDCVDTLARRFGRNESRPPGAPECYDLIIVGAGPAGLSASLRALERGLSCVTLEAEELGGSVAKYPRQKLVMTSPVEFPMHGRFRKLEISKESLLAFWAKVAAQAGDRIRTGERVESTRLEGNGEFTVTTAQKTYRSRAVVLAIGRRGAPRKLGVPGEEQAHVMYSLIDAAAYRDKSILVVGGGDSAVEAALGLAFQRGNRVVISYRKAAFTRLRARNQSRIAEAISQRRVEVIFDSEPVEIRAQTVVLRTGASTRGVRADFVWIFAGGTSPRQFLEPIGIRFGNQDLGPMVQSHSATEAQFGTSARNPIVLPARNTTLEREPSAPRSRA